jgi:hypothetical protein
MAHCNDITSFITCTNDPDCFWQGTPAGGMCKHPSWSTTNPDVIDNLGDVNHDGIINIQDVIEIVNFVLATSQPNVIPPDMIGHFLTYADVNRDGVVNILDVVSIVNQISGITPQTMSAIMNSLQQNQIQPPKLRPRPKPRFKTMSGRTGLKFTRQYRDKRR